MGAPRRLSISCLASSARSLRPSQPALTRRIRAKLLRSTDDGRQDLAGATRDRHGLGVDLPDDTSGSRSSVSSILRPRHRTTHTGRKDATENPARPTARSRTGTSRPCRTHTRVSTSLPLSIEDAGRWPPDRDVSSRGGHSRTLRAPPASLQSSCPHTPFLAEQAETAWRTCTPRSA